MGASGLHTPAYRRLCRLLRRWRADAGLTQRGLAGRVGKPPSWVHKTEVGERRIDPLEFIAWSLACGREPADAITEARRDAGPVRPRR